MLVLTKAASQFWKSKEKIRQMILRSILLANAASQFWKSQEYIRQSNNQKHVAHNILISSSILEKMILLRICFCFFLVENESGRDDSY